jgi:PilZ domain
MATQAHAFSNVAAYDRRNTDRVDVALWGRIRFRGTSHPARICNLSPGGLMAMTPFQLRDYSEVDVEIPVLGWRAGIVAWVNGDNIGVEFDPPLNPSLFDRFATFQNK